MNRRWLLYGLCCLMLFSRNTSAADSEPVVRPGVCAGSWYPGDREALSKEVGRLLAGETPDQPAGKPLAIIAPHAGYRFSAPVAAAAYRSLRGQSYKRVIVLAFSHRYANAYQGVQVPANLTAYETPLGQVPIDREMVDKLRKAPGFVSPAGVDRDEHSLELQLPFLQAALKDFLFVPLLIGRMSNEDYAKAAAAIFPLLDDSTLLVASSDFTHYGPNYDYVPFKDDVEKNLTDLAEKASKPILACDFDGFAEHIDKTRDTICGRGPILLLLRILSMGGGASGIRTAMDTSGRMLNDWTNSVTYQSFVLTRRPGAFNRQEREALLRLARQTVTAVLNKQPLPGPKPDDLPAAVRKEGACFVTLQNHGELRGCIGNMEARGPLYQAVIRNAVSAATQDYRFADRPVTAAELSSIDFEISCLTPMKPVANIEAIIVGRHGLLIGLSGQHGVLLPQVAYERGWTREEFLSQTCRKAGLPLQAWKQKGAEIYTFEAEVFGEAEPNK